MEKEFSSTDTASSVTDASFAPSPMKMEPFASMS